VRRSSVQERLRPYLGESGGNELFYPNKADRPWKYIVLHHSANPAGNYDQIDAEHRKILGYDGCGYHFVIGNGTDSADGRIEVAQRWVNQKHGVHCRNARSAEVDEYGIGICFVGDLDKEPPTPRQVAAAKALIAYLSSRYAIAPNRVETHAHLAATPTVCPGKHFPSGAFLAASTSDAEAASGRTVPTSWRVVRRAGSTAY
jgi:N-acetyl-anhydromuramyl-L-alanine amidase AmpD